MTKVIDLLTSRLIELLAYGYVWDVALGSYITKGSGDTIPESMVLNWQADYVKNVQLNIGDITQKFVDGDLTLQQWQQKMAVEIKDGWITSSAIGRGGRNAMEHSDWGRTGGRLQFEYARLNNFAREIEMGDKLSDAMIMSRAQLYANATRTGYFDGLTHAKMAAGYTHEQRFLNPADHCEDCVLYAAQGIQPIGTLPEPGEACACMRNCKCVKEYLTPADMEGQAAGQLLGTEMSKELPYTGKTDLLTGAQRSTINNAVADFKMRYPNSSINGIEVVDNEIANYRYMAKESGTKIQINADTFTQKEINYMNKHSKFGAANNPYDVITHELGHSVNTDMIVGNVEDVIDFLPPSKLRGLGIDYKDTLQSRLDRIAFNKGSLISEYATTNAEEYFAEAVVEFMRGNTSVIDADLLSIFNRIFK